MAYLHPTPIQEIRESPFLFPLGSDEKLSIVEPESRKWPPPTTATQAGSSWMLEPSTSSVVISQEDDLKRLESLYLLRDSARIREFISRNADLGELLLDAYQHIEAKFGMNPQVSLEVVSDPEEDDFEELFAYIRTSLEPEGALAKLDELDESWFLRQLVRADGKLNLNLEFI